MDFGCFEDLDLKDESSSEIEECCEDDDEKSHPPSRLLISASLNDPGLASRALTGRHRPFEIQFLNEAFLLAASFGHVNTMAVLIEHGAEVDCTDANRCTALHLAVQRDKPETTQWLIDHGANPHLYDSQNTLPLDVAIQESNETIVKILLSHCAPPEVKFPEFNACLTKAVEYNQPNILRMLIEAGCDVNQLYCSGSGRTAFHRAVERGRLACVQVFLEHKVNVQQRDSEGRTPLHMAADGGHLHILKLLIQQDCQPNAEDQDGQTPLFEACSQGYIECVRELVANGALTNVKNRYGVTPIITAAILGRSDVLTLLLRLVGDVNLGGYMRLTALHCACLHGKEDCVRILIKAGAKIDPRGSEGSTPAHMVVRSQKNQTLQIVILRQLLLANFDMEAKATMIYRTEVRKRRLVTPFELALSLGRLQTGCWLALVGCKISVIQNCFNAQDGHGDNVKRDPYVNWLLEKARRPRSLSELCRNRLRYRFGDQLQQVMSALCYPAKLKRFILFEDLEIEELALPWAK